MFDTLDVRRTSFNAGGSGDYALTPQTEVPYLNAHEVRLARVVYEPDAPVSSADAQHVFLELGDHLGSTSTVLDKRTGELVERTTYQAYGGAESDYRPSARWHSFREDYRFTGKEDDVEVGLVYFGKRYLNPLLNRWVSADPLAIHEAGSTDLNLYAYVSGHALKATDRVGLQEVTDQLETGLPPPVDSSGKALQPTEQSMPEMRITGSPPNAMQQGSALQFTAGGVAGHGLGQASGQVPIVGPLVADATSLAVYKLAPPSFQAGFGMGLVSSSFALQFQAGSEGVAAGGLALTGVAAPAAAAIGVHAGTPLRQDSCHPDRSARI